MDYQSQLFFAVCEGDIAIIEQLLTIYPDYIYIKDESGKTPFITACQCGKLIVAQYLLSKGSDITARTNDGSTALHFAISHTEVLQLIIELNKINVNIQNICLQTPLHRAAQFYNLEAIILLLDSGSDIHIHDKYGATVIDILFETRSDFMVSNGKDTYSYIDALLLQLLPPLFIAIYRRSTDDIESLLNNGADPNIERPNGTSPLMWVIRLRDVMSARLLLIHGADPNHIDHINWTPLTFASWWGPVEMIDLLLEYHADPNVRSRSGFTPLHYAAGGGRRVGDQLRAVKALIQAGADPCAQSADGSSPLHSCAAMAIPEVVNYILSLGCDVNAVNQTGRTPLYEAVDNDQFEVARVLLSAGADPNIPDQQGYTPLHLAIIRSLDTENVDLCQFLINYGANINSKDKEGKTPRDIMQEAILQGKIQDTRQIVLFKRCS